MKARAIIPFYDLKEQVDRDKGDEFECSEARFKEINSTQFGTIAEKVPAAKPARAGKRVAK